MRKEAVREMAESLAELDMEEELQKHPELLKEKENILLEKIAEYEREIELSNRKIEEELQVAGEMIHAWFNELPKEQQMQFKKELDQIRTLVAKEEFSKKLLDCSFTSREKTVKEMLGLSEDFIRSLYEKGLSLQESGCHVEAVALNKLILLLYPTFIDSYHTIGFSLFHLKEFEEAQKFFDLSMAFAPQDPKGYYLSAVCHKERHAIEKAQEMCSIGLDLSDNDLTWKKLFQELKTNLLVG